MKKETKIVGDLCNPSRGQIDENQETLIDYVDISSIDSARKKVIRYQTMSLREAPSRARKLAEKGDILVSTVRPNLNSVAILEQDTPNVTVVSTAFCVLNCKETTHNRFLFYYCRSKFFIEDMVSQATGASYPAVSEKIVRMAKVPSYGYDEQKRISTVLDSISRIIDMRKDELEELDNLIKARFVEMFGDPEYSNRHPYVALKELVDVVSGGTPDRRNSEFWDNGTIPWVKTTELKNNRLTETEEYITEKGLNESSAKIVPENTVLIAMYGQGKTRGMTAILDVASSTNQACACLLPSDRIEPDYLWQFMILSYDRLRKLAQGGNQPNLNGNMIKNFTVLVPPKKAQIAFADFVTQVDKSKVVVQKALDEAQLLFDSLLQQYFG